MRRRNLTRCWGRRGNAMGPARCTYGRARRDYGHRASVTRMEMSARREEMAACGLEMRFPSVLLAKLQGRRSRRMICCGETCEGGDSSGCCGWGGGEGDEEAPEFGRLAGSRGSLGRSI